MTRRIFRPTLLLAALLVGACSDTRSTMTSPTAQIPSVLYNTTQALTLDAAIQALVPAVYPHGLATSVLARWTSIKRQLSSGGANSTQVAGQQLFELTQWIQQKIPMMQTPPNGETTNAAAARLVEYMSLYVFSGPDTPVPATTPAADAIVGIATPGATTTLVTPAVEAGVQIPAGAVTSNTIIVITQNPNYYSGNCTGPLPTNRCQYPLFYHIEEFPHVTLQTPATFQVCHVNVPNTNRYPLSDHDTYRIAHEKPADPADYTPGGTIEGGIEILPLHDQSFLPHCPNTTYMPPISPTRVGLMLRRGERMLGELADRIGGYLAPRVAFAIDQGGGGDGLTFSDFNVIDPNSAPDLSVSISTPSVQQSAGASFPVTVTLDNVGTGPSAPTTAALTLVSRADQSVINLGPALSFGGLPPHQATQTGVRLVTLPPNIAAGDYDLMVMMAPSAGEPNTALANNTASTLLTVAVTSPFNSAPGTATIDGVVSPGEWSPAACSPIAVNVPEGGTTPGQICIMNDATNVYFMLSYNRAATNDGTSLSFEFDNDASGTLSAGDDGIIVNPVIGFEDEVRYTDPATGSLFSGFDTAHGGTNDGAGAFVANGNTQTYEMSHPINSGDHLDFALAPGGSIGMQMTLTLINQAQSTARTSFSGPPGFNRTLVLALPPA